MSSGSNVADEIFDCLKGICSGRTKEVPPPDMPKELDASQIKSGA